MPNERSSLLRYVLLTSVVLSASGCSGSAGTAPTPVKQLAAISGRVTSLQTGLPVSGAAVVAISQSAPTVTATTDASGSYSFNVPITTLPWVMTFAADGYLFRQTSLGVFGDRSDVSVNLISTAPPFSLDFFREFVRGSIDHTPPYQPLARWRQAPRIFFLSRTVDTGDPVPDAVIDVMEEMAGRETPQLTGGRYTVAEFGRGPTPPAPATGWIIVSSYSGLIPGSPIAGGVSPVGAQPGSIGLRLDLTPESTCGYLMAGAFFHEMFHALGYYHTHEGFSVNNECGPLLPDAVYHAAIAYARPPGNTDPDTDLQFTVADLGESVR